MEKGQQGGVQPATLHASTVAQEISKRHLDFHVYEFIRFVCFYMCEVNKTWF